MIYWTNDNLHQRKDRQELETGEGKRGIVRRVQPRLLGRGYWVGIRDVCTYTDLIVNNTTRTTTTRLVTATGSIYTPRLRPLLSAVQPHHLHNILCRRPAGRTSSKEDAADSTRGVPSTTDALPPDSTAHHRTTTTTTAATSNHYTIHPDQTRRPLSSSSPSTGPDRCEVGHRRGGGERTQRSSNVTRAKYGRETRDGDVERTMLRTRRKGG